MEYAYWLLPFAAACAGFFDAIVGGGGLIQLPALLIALPAESSIALALGTNKLAGVCGTLIATHHYVKQLKFDWKAILPAACIAFVFSFIGAHTVAWLDPKFVRPMILVLLVCIALYTYLRRNLGLVHRPKLTKNKQFWYSIIVGIVLGFYDGIFGPGTGSFLIFIFVVIFGFDFLTASALTKIVNLCTNLGGLTYFILLDHVDYKIGFSMAICNVIGAKFGARVALSKGSQVVRKLFLPIVWVIILRLGYDMFS
jgi:uncharacterized protein